jgi:hypothetical protein
LLPGVIANYLKCLAQTHSAVSRAVRDAGLVREVELVVPWGARGEAINEFSTRAVINRLREEEEGEHRTQTNAGEATLRWGPRRTVLSSQRDGLRCEVPEREGVVVHSLMEFASTPLGSAEERILSALQSKLREKRDQFPIGVPTVLYLNPLRGGALSDSNVEYLFYRRVFPQERYNYLSAVLLIRGPREFHAGSNPAVQVALLINPNAQTTWPQSHRHLFGLHVTS